MRLALALIAAFLASPALAGTLYIDTAANGSASANFSGSTDTTTAKAGTGAGTATVTCSATAYTGGLPGCTFSGSPDLSAVIATPGPTQDSLYVSCSTQSNQKIVWIIAVDDSADAVETATTSTTAAAPSGCTAATATWNIGGRHVLTNTTIEGALRAGDTAIFNIAPACSGSTECWKFRNPGDSTSGYATIKGKAGSRPILSESGSGLAVVNGNSLALIRVSNLELKQTHVSSGNVLSIGGAGDLVDNVKISVGSQTGLVMASANGMRFINSEITAMGGACATTASGSFIMINDVLHNCTGDGLTDTLANATGVIIGSVIANNGGRGIYFNAAATAANSMTIYGTTITGNTFSGIETNDADTSLVIAGNILTDNGSTTGRANVLAGVTTQFDLNSWHAYNDYWCTGLSANNCTNTAQNLSALTADYFLTSEILTNPSMSGPGSNPPNVTFTSSSPAYAAGNPGSLLGASGTGYMSLGPYQVQGTAGGGGGQGIIGGGM